MRFLPEDSFVLRSALSPAELSERLNQATTAPRFRVLPNFSNVLGLGQQAYRGEVHATGFEVSPDVSSFNLMKPSIYGRYQPSNDGTVISVSQEVSTLGKSLLLLRISIAGIVVLAFWWTAVFGAGIEMWERLAGVAIPAVIYRFCIWFEHLPFLAGADAAKKDLVKRFDATEYTTSVEDAETK